MTEEKSGLSRRTIVKGAAWSVPVVAAAVATPLAAASVNSASVVWTAGTTQLLNLTLLDGNPLAGARVLPSAPLDFRITNTPGVIPNVTATVTVALATGISLNLSLLADRYLAGFAPRSIPGATVLTPAAISNREVQAPVFIGPVKTIGGVYAQDTTTTFAFGDVSEGQFDFGSIVWGVAAKYGGSLGVDVSVLTTFTVNVAFFSNGSQFATLSGQNITLLANAGIL